MRFFQFAWVGLFFCMHTMCLGQVICYVDPQCGDDSAAGNAQAPWKTLAHAVSQLEKDGGVLHLVPDAVYHEPLRISDHNSNSPIVIEGHNATIDLGTDISAGPWHQDGDGYILDQPVPRKKNYACWQMANVYVNNHPISAFDPRRHASPRPGELQHLDDDRLRVVFPKGITPDKACVILNPDYGISCVSLLRGNVTIRQLHARHAGNDGFNIHGIGDNILLDQITAMYCGDEGISAHESSIVRVVDSIVAFNGSQAGGIADVNQSVTSYLRCASIGNRGNAFYFDSSKHIVEDFLSAGNSRPITRIKNPQFTMKNVYEITPESHGDLPERLIPLFERCLKLLEISQN